MTRGFSSWNSSKGNVELATNEFALAQRAPSHRFSTFFSSEIRYRQVSREKRSFLALLKDLLLSAFSSAFTWVRISSESAGYETKGRFGRPALLPLSPLVRRLAQRALSTPGEESNASHQEKNEQNDEY
jgi:hypothetical protein